MLKEFYEELSKMLKLNNDVSKKEEKEDNSKKYVQIDNEKVCLNSLVENYIKMQSQSKVDNENDELMNDDDEVEVEGKKVKISEMKKAYNGSKEEKAKNESEEKEKKEKKEEKAENETEDEEEKEEKKEEKEEKKEEKEEKKEEKEEKKVNTKLNNSKNTHSVTDDSTRSLKSNQYELGKEKY